MLGRFGEKPSHLEVFFEFWKFYRFEKKLCNLKPWPILMNYGAHLLILLCDGLEKITQKLVGFIVLLILTPIMHEWCQVGANFVASRFSKNPRRHYFSSWVILWPLGVWPGFLCVVFSSMPSLHNQLEIRSNFVVSRIWRELNIIWSAEMVLRE